MDSHRALALYLGERPHERFNLMQRSSSPEGALFQFDFLRLILESRQLQANLTRPDELFRPELAELKTMGRQRVESGENLRLTRAHYAITDDIDTAKLRSDLKRLADTSPAPEERASRIREVVLSFVKDAPESRVAEAAAR